MQLNILDLSYVRFHDPSNFQFFSTQLGLEDQPENDLQSPEALPEKKRRRWSLKRKNIENGTQLHNNTFLTVIAITGREEHRISYDEEDAEYDRSESERSEGAPNNLVKTSSTSITTSSRRGRRGVDEDSDVGSPERGRSPESHRGGGGLSDSGKSLMSSLSLDGLPRAKTSGLLSSLSPRKKSQKLTKVKSDRDVSHRYRTWLKLTPYRATE